MRRPLILVLVTLACLATPAAAWADLDVDVSGGGQLSITSLTAGEGNVVQYVSISSGAGGFDVELSELGDGAWTDLPVGCTVPSGTLLRCEGLASEGVVLDLGPGDDTLTVPVPADAGPVSVSGGPGTDTLAGGDDTDSLWGGTGADTLTGRGGTDFLQGLGGAAAAADDGNDVMTGGDGQDFFMDDGDSTGDRVEYSDRASGVTVTFDNQANDGNADDGVTARDNVGTGIDWVMGSQQGDTLTGGPGAERLDGLGGADTVTGGSGHDQLFGGGGVDTLNAVDSVVDVALDCGSAGFPGDGVAGEVANVDADDPTAADCATVNRGTGGGTGGDTGGTTGGGQTTGGQTTGKDTTAPGTTTTSGPAEGAVLRVGVAKDTRVTVRMPNVVGELPDPGRNRLLDAVPDVDLDWMVVRRCREADDYRIVAQSPKPGTAITTRQLANVRVRLQLCLSDRDFLRDCDTGAIAKDLERFRKKTDAELAIDVVLKVSKCKADYDVRLAKTAEEAKVGLSAQTRLKQGQVRAAIDCPTGKGNQDLWLVPGGGYNGTDRPGRQTFYGLHEDHPRLGWTVPAGPHQVRMTVKILDRAFQTVNANQLFVDWDDTRKGAPKETLSVVNGQAIVNAADLRPGKIRMCAIKETGGDAVLSGALEITVVEKPPVNSTWVDVTGRRLRVGTTAPIWESGGSVTQVKARAAQTGIGFIDWLVGLFSGTSRSINAAASAGGETVVRQQADRIYQDTGASLGQLTMDGTLARSPEFAQSAQGSCFGVQDGRTFEGTCPVLAPKSQDAMKVGMSGNPASASRIVAAGGGNVLSHNGGTIVAAGAGNIVAAGGGNIVAAGAGNAVPDVAKIVAAGGLNFTPNVGGRIVAAGGLN